MNLEQWINAIDIKYLLPYFSFVFLHFVTEPLRWSLYLRSLNRYKFSIICHVFFLTSFLSYIFPVKLGLPVRVVLLKLKLHLNLPAISGYLLLDGGLYYGAWTVSALVAILFSLSRFKHNININVVTGVLAALIIIFFVVRFVLKYKSGRPNQSHHFVEKIKRWREQVLSTYREFNFEIFLTIVAVLCLDIMSQIFRHWALLKMLGYELPMMYFFIITTLSIFTGLISMMPMGLGGYDITVVLLLTQASIPLEAAVAVPVLNRFGTIFMSFLLGIWSSLSLDLNLFNLDWLKHQIRKVKDGL